MPNRQDPFFRTVEYVRDQAKRALDELAMGRWETLEQARNHSARYKAMRDVLEEMRSAGGTGTDFGEENIMNEVLKP